MLIAEDLLLLLYDDDSGKPATDATRLDTALAGAVLLELSLGGQVGIADDSGPTKAGRLVVTSGESTGEPVLDDAMTVVADAEGKKPAQVLGKLKKGLRDRLLAGLAERGILHAEAGKVLGLFPPRGGPRWTLRTRRGSGSACTTSWWWVSSRTSAPVR